MRTYNTTDKIQFLPSKVDRYDLSDLRRPLRNIVIILISSSSYFVCLNVLMGLIPSIDIIVGRLVDDLVVVQQFVELHKSFLDFFLDIIGIGHVVIKLYNDVLCRLYISIIVTQTCFIILTREAVWLG